MSIHKKYLELTASEREFVDRVFCEIYKPRMCGTEESGADYVPLAGDDRAERAVEAFSVFVIESRAGKESV